jgi:hypothetical protein
MSGLSNPMARRISVRLDNGSLLTASSSLTNHGGAVVLSPEQLLPLGRVTENDLRRLEKLLVQLHGKLPHAQPLTSIVEASLKRKGPDAVQVQAVSVKGNYSLNDSKGRRHTEAAGLVDAAIVVTPQSNAPWPCCLSN